MRLYSLAKATGEAQSTSRIPYMFGLLKKGLFVAQKWNLSLPFKKSGYEAVKEKGFFSLLKWRTEILPESEHSAHNLRFAVGEAVITHSSAASVAKNFYASFARTATAY